MVRSNTSCSTDPKIGLVLGTRRSWGRKTLPQSRGSRGVAEGRVWGRSTVCASCPGVSQPYEITRWHRESCPKRRPEPAAFQLTLPHCFLVSPPLRGCFPLMCLCARPKRPGTSSSLLLESFQSQLLVSLFLSLLRQIRDEEGKGAAWNTGAVYEGERITSRFSQVSAPSGAPRAAVTASSCGFLPCG